MEFASEMVVKAALHGLHDRRGADHAARRTAARRPPHLRTWRDGWRHLRFLLLYSPRWLFLYPGLLLTVPGPARRCLPVPGRHQVRSLDAGHQHVHCRLHGGLDRRPEHHLRGGSRRYATLRGLLPPSARYSALLRSLTPERLLAAGVVLFIVTLVGLAYSVYRWVSVSFGPLPDTACYAFLPFHLPAWSRRSSCGWSRSWPA